MTDQLADRIETLLISNRADEAAYVLLESCNQDRTVSYAVLCSLYRQQGLTPSPGWMNVPRSVWDAFVRNRLRELTAEEIAERKITDRRQALMDSRREVRLQLYNDEISLDSATDQLDEINHKLSEYHLIDLTPAIAKAADDWTSNCLGIGGITEDNRQESTRRLIDHLTACLTSTNTTGQERNESL